MSARNESGAKSTGAKGTGAKGTEPTAEGIAFGRYLRDLRKSKGFNQAELAQRVDITGGYYGFFEQGRQIPSLKIISRLAEVLDVDYVEMAKMAGYNEFEAIKKRPLRSQSIDLEDETADSAGNGQEEAERGDGATDADRPQSDRPQSGGAQSTSTAGHTVGDANGRVSQERLDWALMCIAHDPTYKLADQFTQGALADNVKALVVQLYQAQTRRQLLTPEESAVLNAMVHG